MLKQLLLALAVCFAPTIAHADDLTAPTLAYLAGAVADTASTIYMGPGHQFPVGFNSAGGWPTSHEADPLIAWAVNSHPNLLYVAPAIEFGIAMGVRHFIAPHHRKIAKVLLWSAASLHFTLATTNYLADRTIAQQEAGYIAAYGSNGALRVPRSSPSPLGEWQDGSRAPLGSADGIMPPPH